MARSAPRQPACPKPLRDHKAPRPQPPPPIGAACSTPETEDNIADRLASAPRNRGWDSKLNRKEYCAGEKGPQRAQTQSKGAMLREKPQRAQTNSYVNVPRMKSHNAMPNCPSPRRRGSYFSVGAELPSANIQDCKARPDELIHLTLRTVFHQRFIVLLAIIVELRDPVQSADLRAKARPR
ncbi:hypothetical protein KSP40_PGU003468 [Platanthera guangdongensis]|uniref:Uncharacterized protein n=1 Tax=Platanthera guangdongensis TaxID=2320717 RepID=A0ABR2MJ10_9ASPA